MPAPPSFHFADLEQNPLRCSGLLRLPPSGVMRSYYQTSSARFFTKSWPNWKVISPQELVKRINREKLAGEYAKLREDFEQSNIFDGDALRKIASAIGVRYVFQPRLAAFSQTMTDRWSFLPFDLRIMQTRSSNMRVWLQLWDAETGEMVWTSMAETTMQNEAAFSRPRVFGDVARATLGGMVGDLNQPEEGLPIYPPE